MIKLLLTERGSELANEAWDGASRRVSTRLLYPEARAALAAAARSRVVSESRLRRLVTELDAMCASVLLVDTDPALGRQAGEDAELHGLRGYDAMHLATGRAAGCELFVTWDDALAAAARAAGLSTAPG